MSSQYCAFKDWRTRPSEESCLPVRTVKDSQPRQEGVALSCGNANEVRRLRDQCSSGLGFVHHFRTHKHEVTCKKTCTRYAQSSLRCAGSHARAAAGRDGGHKGTALSHTWQADALTAVSRNTLDPQIHAKMSSCAISCLKQTNEPVTNPRKQALHWCCTCNSVH